MRENALSGDKQRAGAYVFPESPYAKGKVMTNQAINPAASANVDLDTTGYSKLVVMIKLAATTTPADLGFAARAYEDDGVTLHDLGFPVAAQVAATSDGTNVRQTNAYDLRGVDKLQLRVANNNVAAKNATVTYFLQR